MEGSCTLTCDQNNEQRSMTSADNLGLLCLSRLSTCPSLRLLDGMFQRPEEPIRICSIHPPLTHTDQDLETKPD